MRHKTNNGSRAYVRQPLTDPSPNKICATPQKFQPSRGFSLLSSPAFKFPSPHPKRALSIQQSWDSGAAAIRPVVLGAGLHLRRGSVAYKVAESVL